LSERATFQGWKSPSRDSFIYLHYNFQVMRWIAILLLCFSLNGHAQFTEDFSDNDFTNNPVWSGDVGNYTIYTSTGMPSSMIPGLRTLNTIADTTWLSAPNSMTLTDSLEWTFWAKMSFNPSTGNFSRVYLVSDQQNLRGSLNGYFVGLSHTGVDRLFLVRQDGVTLNPIITGTIANFNKTTNIVRVRVKRDNAGNWTMYSDTLGGDNFALEGTANDVTYTNSAYIGVFNQYTVSNANSCYFDEFYAGPILVDTIAPSVVKVEATSAFTVDVYFDEFISPATAVNGSNYLVDLGVGNPSTAVLDGGNAALVHLTLANPVYDGVLYHLSVSNIEDLNSNVISSVSIPFAYYVPQAFDVVINEIMADPTPAVMLPEYEYVELYNTTTLPISLKNYTLRIGSSDKTIGDVTIGANDYLILCDDGAESLLSVYGDVFAFTSFSITNTGANILLLSPAGAVLSFAEFTDEWYFNSFKADGGWSVEQIDPMNPCSGKYNWKASEDNKGGTPGATNSVNSVNGDAVQPELLRASLENDSTIRLWFSEPMDSATVLNPFSYTISNGLLVVGQPQGFSPQYQSVILYLDQAIQYGTIYTVSITDTLTDCVGNILSLTSSARFAIADSIEAGDLVINEILSNPVTDVQDFVEIVNRSNKILDLRFLTVATLNDSLQLDDQNYITPNGYLIFPGEYLAFTEDRDALNNYYITNANQVIQIDNLPAYNNDEGTVVLAMAAGSIIDEVVYNVSMHDPFLSSTDGVSLERINFNRASNDSTNWHSAASTAGFATPGYINSQYSESEGTSTVNVSPEAFSPDNDGYNDVLNISWQFSRPGLICNMKIFDSNGRFIKQLLKNETIGQEGVVSWDGTNENDEKAPSGIYVIFTEVFSSDGYTEKIKTVATLAVKF